MPKNYQILHDFGNIILDIISRSGWIFHPGQLPGSKIKFLNVHSSNFSLVLCKQFRPRIFKSHKSNLYVFGENSINHFEVLGRAEFTNGNWFTQKNFKGDRFTKTIRAWVTQIPNFQTLIFTKFKKFDLIELFKKPRKYITI